MFLRPHIQCYLDIFLLLGLGSFTWRSLDGIWRHTHIKKHYGGGWTQVGGEKAILHGDKLISPSPSEIIRVVNTHCARHLIQLTHGLVDSSFQVIIQFPRSVGHIYILHYLCFSWCNRMGTDVFFALRQFVSTGTEFQDSIFNHKHKQTNS